VRGSRPLLLRILPPRLRGSAWSRLYHPTVERYHGLFSEAELHFAPSVRMCVVPGDVISDSIAFTGIYDLPFTRLLRRLAIEGGHLVDVGANLGYFSLLWTACKAGNTVTAFEASARNVELLKYNVAENHFDDRIEVCAKAVGKVNCEMEFDPGQVDQTGWGGLALSHSERSERVPVVRLDDALANVEQIALLKIDIEGADTWALTGAEKLFREKRIKHVWWEQHKPRMRELGIPEGQAADLMRDAGYWPAPQGNPQADLVNWYATSL